MTSQQPEDGDEQNSPIPPTDRDADRHAGDSSGFRPDAERAAGGSREDAPDTQASDAKQELEAVDGNAEEADLDFSPLEEREVQIAVVAARMAAQRSESFSGLIPHPDDWDRYGDVWHERIMRMSEAFTTDESSRRDQIVTGMVEEAPKSRRNALWLGAGSMLLAFGSEALLESTVLACAFLTLPVMSMVRSFLGDRRRAQHSDDDSE